MKIKDNIIQIGKDFILNFFATMLSVIILMFIVYPKQSEVLGLEQYGYIISLYGYSQMILGILIAKIGHSRLLAKESLEKNKKIIVLFGTLKKQ